jgi:hypothetical protein
MVRTNGLYFPASRLTSARANRLLFLHGLRHVLDCVLAHILQPAQRKPENLDRKGSVGEILSRDQQEGLAIC